MKIKKIKTNKHPLTATLAVRGMKDSLYSKNQFSKISKSFERFLKMMKESARFEDDFLNFERFF